MLTGNLSKIFVLSMLVLVLAACNNEPKKDDTEKVAEEKNEAKFDNQKENDASFLVDAAEINLEEIQLGKLAQQKGSMAEVKEFGKMMVDEHEKALADLKTFAATKQITIPTNVTEDNIDEYKDLSNKKLKNFDEAYCDKMVKGHKDAIEKFERVANNNDADSTIRSFASNMLPSLRKHLEHAIVCQQKCEAANK